MTQEHDPYAYLTSLSFFDLIEHISFADWDIDSTLGCSAWVEEQEKTTDKEPLEIHTKDGVHAVTPDVEQSQARSHE